MGDVFDLIVFCKALLRFDAKDAASTFCVSKTRKWKAQADLESVQEELWESLVIRRHSPRLAASCEASCRLHPLLLVIG